jgi:hypothetical protein
LLLLEPQASQVNDLPRDKRLEYGFQFAEGGSAFTLWDHTSAGVQPIVCCGALRRHPGYATLWALFSVHKPRVPIHLTRTVRDYVASLRERRIDAQVAAGNRGAMGWAKLIGLDEETRLRGAMPDGDDMVIFIRKGES